MPIVSKIIESQAQGLRKSELVQKSLKKRYKDYPKNCLKIIPKKLKTKLPQTSPQTLAKHHFQIYPGSMVSATLIDIMGFITVV